MTIPVPEAYQALTSVDISVRGQIVQLTTTYTLPGAIDVNNAAPEIPITNPWFLIPRF